MNIFFRFILLFLPTVFLLFIIYIPLLLDVFARLFSASDKDVIGGNLMFSSSIHIKLKLIGIEYTIFPNGVGFWCLGLGIVLVLIGIITTNTRID